MGTTAVNTNSSRSNGFLTVNRPLGQVSAALEAEQDDDDEDDDDDDGKFSSMVSKNVSHPVRSSMMIHPVGPVVNVNGHTADDEESPQEDDEDDGHCFLTRL